jgi:hypothetical protein
MTWNHEMKKCYISGAIDGIPFEEVQTKFAAAEEKLTAAGYKTVSPLKNGIPCHIPWESHIAMNIVLLMGCESLYLLSDWRFSKAATLEKNIAELTGKEIIYENAPTFTELKRAISEVTGIAFYEITNECRERNRVYARMIYAQFCRKQGATVTDIVREIRRNHSTVVYYLQKFENERKFNRTFREIAGRVETFLVNNEQ